MKIVDGIKYSKEHEWVKVDGEKGYVGITDYAQNNMGEIVYVELPEMGASLKAGDEVGSVDSVKAASEIYTPIAGSVIEINEALRDAPEKLNQQPFESWIAVLQLADPSDADKLMDAAEYEAFCKTGE